MWCPSVLIMWSLAVSFRLVIVADVMVVTEMGQARGEKVATYKGMMQLGTWGSDAPGPV